jgi:CheY-like chemotaxis protein
MPPPRDRRLATVGDGNGDPVSAISHEELLSEVAHAFRTPLGVITGYVELLQLRDDPQLREEALHRIEGAAQRLAQAVDRLVSVLESDSGDLARRFVEMHHSPLHAPRESEAFEVPPLSRGPTGETVRRIVIVDDDDDIRALLLRTLPGDGFEILEARDGREALSLIEQEAPDLLLLDWNMPNATGGDVLEELARREVSVPVIVLTADDEDGRREIAEAYGADGFLSKPFSPIELLRAIERLLG